MSICQCGSNNGIQLYKAEVIDTTTWRTVEVKVGSMDELYKLIHRYNGYGELPEVA